MIEPLRLRVPRYDLDLAIELLPDLAPETAAALTSALPVAGLVSPETGYYQVVCLRIPDFPRPLRAENATAFPIPGDVFVFERDHGVELVVYYGRSAPPYGLQGYQSGNRVGAVTKDLTTAVYDAAYRIWSEGAAWGVLGPSESVAVSAAADDREAVVAEVEVRRRDWLRRTGREHRGPTSRSGRRIALMIPEYGARTEIELATDRAPHSCSEIWSHIPVETRLMHGRYSGPEMFTQIGGKEWHWTPQKENPIAYPIPGDLVLYIDPPPRIQVNYFYDRGSIPAGTPSPEVGNLVGHSVDDFSQFAEACWRMQYDGWKTLAMERME